MAKEPKGLVSQRTIMLPLELKHFKISQFFKDGNQFPFEEGHLPIKLEGNTSSM